MLIDNTKEYIVCAAIHRKYPREGSPYREGLNDIMNTWHDGASNILKDDGTPMTKEDFDAIDTNKFNMLFSEDLYRCDEQEY